MITQRGLLALCRLELASLNIGKVISNIGRNGYGDEEALLVARHFPSLQKL